MKRGRAAVIVSIRFVHGAVQRCVGVRASAPRDIRGKKCKLFRQFVHCQFHDKGKPRIREGTMLGYGCRAHRSVGDQKKDANLSFLGVFRQRIEILVLDNCGVSLVCIGDVLWNPLVAEMQLLRRSFLQHKEL